MRVSCLQEHLAKGLSIVGRAVPSRTPMSILNNVLLEATDNQLRLAATNLEIGVICWIDAKVEDAGAIMLPARQAAEFVNSLPPERIDMELAVRTQTLHFRCASVEANLKGLDAAKFPNIPTFETLTAGADGAALQIELGATVLRKMVDQVVFAASTDESRPGLTGVEVTFKEGRLTMAATDGHRLSVRSAAVEGRLPVEPVTVIVPARSLSELARISADADESRPVQVFVTQERNQILFQIWGKSGESRGGAFQRVELVSQLIDASFPNFRLIIPKTYNTRTVVDTAALRKALHVARLFAGDNSNVVSAKIQPAGDASLGRIRLTATSAQVGDSVNELDATVEGEGLEASFNAEYLIDVLSRIEEPQVVIETTQGRNPCVIRPLGVSEDEFLYIVMPVYLPSR